ncbi:MAG: hypothetical protein ACTSVV_14255 [Promethearchaeota archaeon]
MLGEKSTDRALKCRARAKWRGCGRNSSVSRVLPACYQWIHMLSG